MSRSVSDEADSWSGAILRVIEILSAPVLGAVVNSAGSARASGESGASTAAEARNIMRVRFVSMTLAALLIAGFGVAAVRADHDDQGSPDQSKIGRAHV